jgi:hypothetical protein
VSLMGTSNISKAEVICFSLKYGNRPSVFDVVDHLMVTARIIANRKLIEVAKYELAL